MTSINQLPSSYQFAICNPLMQSCMSPSGNYKQNPFEVVPFSNPALIQQLHQFGVPSGLSGVHPSVYSNVGLSGVHPNVYSNVSPFNTPNTVNALNSFCPVDPLSHHMQIPRFNQFSQLPLNQMSQMNQINSIPQFGQIPQLNQFGQLPFNQLSQLNQIHQSYPHAGMNVHHTGLNVPNVTPIQEITKDLIIDRTRDFNNLELVSDVADACSQPRATDMIISHLAQGVVPATPQHIAMILCNDRCIDKFANMLIGNVANNIRFNRRTNEILSNLVRGIPHTRRVDEERKNKTDDAIDLGLARSAQQLLADSNLGNSVWVGRQKAERKMKAIRELMTPNAFGQIDPSVQIMLNLIPQVEKLYANGVGPASVVEHLSASGTILPRVADSSMFFNADVLGQRQIGFGGMTGFNAPWTNSVQMGGQGFPGSFMV
ncbi:hypothetical protein BATDEDRAFT_88877 [Batrachochytrium dendrobatidis JAM81]|uniref:Uncharacterized protein n=1 Tax=Batrachochytrium dendrobatidis (strain JAM81 / FGSC 10211) TaxID=684364 RepID=F4P2T7_BATDJ|nr:uncharacterized protein BATDEDRAFT_88877 [Batrachochytrium dendrobatidis JAM81]EGF80079.1 hypothetical protein BATDEDRAFT_88877 [Batrachochytrium dendrobatidis JAM81]|eukprot:XP_006679161.1 hypothetical protein BATDEDRAFT_88877 [Batrachochytrium dendrobatidis JAM81]